ncbi:MAG TPA: EI24 domain-containing protein [Saprospiraceae bacterium]|nr:EI24 domain-containing protein [Saprospiraceae bacterium]HMP12623.1 EI24 domain-containing protein [Saprospiraceae bacterium]
MFKDFSAGISAYRKALQLIPALGLWGYIFVPALISMLLAVGIIWGAISVADDLGSWLISLYPLEWGKNAVQKAANIFSGLLVIAIGLMLFKNLVIALSSPIMSPLSEKVEKALTGSPGRVSTSFSGVISDLIRGIRISIRLIIKELFFTILLLLLGVVVPFLSPFIAAAIFIVQCYYGGAGNIDFALERHFRVRESVQFVRRHRALAIGNGVAYILLLFSGIGFLVALPLGVIAATIETVKRINQ